MADPWYTTEFRRRAGELDVTGKALRGRGLEEFGKGGELFRRGVETLGQPLSYYQGLLGSRQEALTAAAPEISTIHGQFDTAARAVSEFAPRGGGRVAAAGELPFAKQAAIQDVITKQRPEAAKGITEIGQLLSSLGLSQEHIGGILANLGISEEQLSLQALEGAAGLGERAKERKAKLMGGLGKAAGSIIGGLLI